MSCSCFNRVDGASSEGITLAEALAWEVVYEVDFRDARTAIGSDVDLDSPGNSFTFEGITWVTPAVVNGFPVDQVSSSTWELDLNGLSVNIPDNSRMISTNTSAPSIIASLADISANTATPFDGDPTRIYRAEVFISSQAFTVAGPADEGSGIAIGKNNGPAGSNQTLSNSNVGIQGGTTFVPSFESESGASPANFDRSDLAGSQLDVPVIVCAAPGLRYRGGFVTSFDTTAFRLPGITDRFCGAGQDGVLSTDEDTVGDPSLGYNFHIFHNSPTLTSTYRTTIQRFRLLRR